MQFKEILLISKQPNPHWVGDGFFVNNIFSYHNQPQLIDPFLLLDYGAPTHFPPAKNPRGVGAHPHRGFETVTLIYQGEVEHRDNHGNYGKITPGAVQWMTAGAGVLHAEMHSQEFTKTGGIFEVIQLWVNLPAQYKMSPAKYQEITAAQIPYFYFPKDLGYLRIIAGNYHESFGPAQTFSPINLFDGYLTANSNVILTLPSNFTLIIFLLAGSLIINNTQELHGPSAAIFARQAENVLLSTQTNCKFIVLNGQPINEPIVGHGPFVMNTLAEIRQAFSDFQNNQF